MVRVQARASLFVALSLLAACGNTRRTPPSPSATATATATTPAPAAEPAPVGPFAVDLVLAQAPTSTGTLEAATVLRESRSIIAAFRECARMMPEDTEFGLMFVLSDVGAVRELGIHGELHSGTEACLRRVGTPLRFTPPLPGAAGPEGNTISARFKAIARPEGVAIDPSLACASDDECVFVAGSCERPFVVNRAHAAYVDDLRRRALAGTDCPARTVTQGFAAMCHRGVCTDRELDAQTLTCSSDAQCTVVYANNGRPTPVAKARARQVVATGAYRAATSADVAPPVACEYGVCLLPWAGLD